MIARRKKAITWFSILFGMIILLTLLLGLIIFPRPSLPPIIRDDTCSRYNIRFDGTSIETIYHAPESILADPQAFRQNDPAYVLLGEHRARVNDPFPLEAWLNDIQALADRPAVEREQRPSYRLYQLILANQASFCQEVVTAVLPYLPDGAAANVTIYLTALEGSALAFSKDREIAFSLSHPLFSGAQLIHEPTGLSAFYNLGLHELFHNYFGSVYPWPTVEEHMANEVVIDMLMALQNEGIATHISHQLNATYSSPFEWFLYLIDQKPIVRLYINEINELFAVAQTRPTGEAYEAIYRDIASLCYQKKGFYIVGAYMAMTIEHELGREALVRTVSDGYEAFATAYNAVAEEEMKIHWANTP
jgi:hypothetical protein